MWRVYVENFMGHGGGTCKSTNSWVTVTLGACCLALVLNKACIIPFIHFSLPDRNHRAAFLRAQHSVCTLAADTCCMDMSI
jgi:hypothetical protein